MERVHGQPHIKYETFMLCRQNVADSLFYVTDRDRSFLAKLIGLVSRAWLEYV